MEVIPFQTSDKLGLCIQYYPAAFEKAVVVFLAGIESHGGWYEDSLSFLQNHGVTSYFIDRRGSGKSSGMRGDIPNCKRLLQDLNEVIEFITSRHRSIPKALAAISWGAKWAYYYWIKTKVNSFQKLLLITPGLFRKVDLPMNKKISAAFACVTDPRRTFKVPIETEMFTRKKVKADYLDQDPYRLRKVTARFLKLSFEMDREIQRFQGVFSQPAYLFQAGMDRIVDNEKTVLFLKKHFFDLRENNYPNACHTLEFEPGINYKKDLALAVLE